MLNIETENQMSGNGFSSNNAFSKDENRFKISTFEELINPLRSDHPFGNYYLPPYLFNNKFINMLIKNIEIWAPKEVALFEACICKFGKNF